MTADDVLTVVKLVGGVDLLTKEHMARVLVREYQLRKDTERELKRVIEQRRELAVRLDNPRRRPGVREVEEERDRFRELYEVTLKRNEILSAKLRGAAA